jgi:uncharacterized integral membrane protein
MKTKIILLMVIIVLFTIFVSQNTQVVELNIYFWQVQMSLIVLLSLIGFVGLLAGFIVARVYHHSVKKEEEKKLDSEQAGDEFNDQKS